jgi:hypothetical protein
MGMWTPVVLGLLAIGQLGDGGAALKETSVLPSDTATVALMSAYAGQGSVQWLDEAMVFCDEPGAELLAPECATLRRAAAPGDARVPWGRVARVQVRTGFEGRLVRAAADVP